MPVVTIWVGVFPMRVNFWMALGSTIYFSANTAVLFYFKSFSCAAVHAPIPFSMIGRLTHAPSAQLANCPRPLLT